MIIDLINHKYSKRHKFPKGTEEFIMYIFIYGTLLSQAHIHEHLKIYALYRLPV